VSLNNCFWYFVLLHKVALKKSTWRRKTKKITNHTEPRMKFLKEIISILIHSTLWTQNDNPRNKFHMTRSKTQHSLFFVSHQKSNQILDLDLEEHLNWQWWMSISVLNNNQLTVAIYWSFTKGFEFCDPPVHFLLSE